MLNFYHIYKNSLYKYICYIHCKLLHIAFFSKHSGKHMLLVIGYDVLKNIVLLEEYFLPLQQGGISLPKEVNVYSL